MTRKEAVSYGTLLAVAVLGSLGVRLWFDRQNREAVSWADRIVQQAILILWKEPWMQEFAETQIAELKTRYLADVPKGEIPSGETLDRMRRDFVAALIQLSAFQRDFPRCIELAAIELDQAIAWSD
jgi:hypothetical protein